MRVLVLDGNERAALAVTRSLGRAGHEVLVGEERAPALAFGSRFAAGRVIYPSPDAHPEAFGEVLVEILGRRQVDLLLPVTEKSTQEVLALRERLPPAVRLPFASPARFEEASDKGRLMATARGLGLPVPEGRLVEDPAGVPPGDWPRLLAGLPWPVVVKPCRSRVRQGGRWLKARAKYAARPEEIGEWVRRDPVFGQAFLVQRIIEGEGTGAFVLAREGRILAAFAHRRLREKPPTGGVSTLRESAPLEEEILRSTRLLIAHLRWDGVAMVEFKRERSSGIPYLMEINGRFWGSLQLAIDAGVDFPRLLVEGAEAGEGLDAGYRIGVRSRWLLGDLDHLIEVLRHAPAVRRVQPGLPGRARTLGCFLLDFLRPDTRLEVLRLGDWRPFLEELRQYVGGLPLPGRRAEPGDGRPARPPAGEADLPPARFRRVLFLCTGNVCRSPLAERAFQVLAGGGEPGGPRCESAGLEVRISRPARLEMDLAARALGPGFSLAGHASRPVTGEMLEAADLVFVMDRGQLRRLRSRYPRQAAKAHLLGRLDPLGEAEIRDPYDRPFEEYLRVAEQIRRCVGALAERRRAAGDARE